MNVRLTSFGRLHHQSYKGLKAAMMLEGDLDEHEIDVLAQKLAGRTNEMIGELLGKTADNVNGLYAAALAKLRPEWRDRYLAALLEVHHKPRGKRYRMVHASQVEAIV